MDDLQTKVQVNGSLETPDGGSAEGNYELKIMARPAGEGQVQKSAQMKVIKDVTVEEISGGVVSTPSEGSAGEIEESGETYEPGDIIWEKSYGGSDYDEAQSIQQTTDGGFIVVGASDSNDGDVSGNNGGYDFWIVKNSRRKRPNSPHPHLHQLPKPSKQATWQWKMSGSRTSTASMMQMAISYSTRPRPLSWSRATAHG